jgi:hypothetical protein
VSEDMIYSGQDIDAEIANIELEEVERPPEGIIPQLSNNTEGVYKKRSH